MSSALDVHRQEAQRDFGDPIGISSRALLEGLFGIQPDLLAGRVRIRPGFPKEWNHAALKHKDFDFTWKREGLRETYTFSSRLPKPVELSLTLPALTSTLPTATSAGRRIDCTFDPEAVGAPTLRLTLPAAQTFAVDITWNGRPPMASPTPRHYRLGDRLDLPAAIKPAQIEDPQSCLTAGHIAAGGFHTVFARMHEADCTWHMPISFTATAERPQFAQIPRLRAGHSTDPVDLSPILTHRITDTFTRNYADPRSPFCSLSFPDTLLGGWANLDGMARIDDAGLRAARGILHTAIGVDFRTPAANAPNCRFLSHWKQDQPSLRLPLTGRASALYLLVTGTTLPQCSRMRHATVTVSYSDDTAATLELRNPENWWPIEQDYLLDDYLFVNEAPLPPRVDLLTGQTRLLDHTTFKGKGRMVPGGAATILHLPLDPAKQLRELKVEAELYGIVVALLAATLVRPQAST